MAVAGAAGAAVAGAGADMISLFSSRKSEALPGVFRNVPQSMLLQWHITDRCNGRCAHCYQDGFSGGSDLDFNDLAGILNQFLEWIETCDRVNGGGKTRAHITVTGGEPFVREDCLDLLDLIAAHRERCSLAILTNGTLIDERLACYLKYLKPRFVQVSLEGSRPTHDRIRGNGNYDMTISGIHHLVRQAVPTLISFTAHRGNYREFPHVVKTGKALRVNRIWADRYVPLGQGKAMDDLSLSAGETREFFKLLAASRPGRFSIGRRTTEVACHRALQFLRAGGRPYACAAGSTLLTVLANGDLVPCRRMPVVAGNLLRERLADLYRENDMLRNLRRRNQTIAGCEICDHRRTCRGGLRCLSYAMYGDTKHADPGCWLANP